MIIVNSLWSILTEIIRCAAPLVHQLNRRPPPTPPTPPQTPRPTRPTPTRRAHAAAAQASSCQELPLLLVDLGLVTLAIGLSVLLQFRSNSEFRAERLQNCFKRRERFKMLISFSSDVILCQGVIRDVLVKIKAGKTKLIQSMIRWKLYHWTVELMSKIFLASNNINLLPQILTDTTLDRNVKLINPW